MEVPEGPQGSPEQPAEREAPVEVAGTARRVRRRDRHLVVLIRVPADRPVEEHCAAEREADVAAVGDERDSREVPAGDVHGSGDRRHATACSPGTAGITGTTGVPGTARISGG